MKKVEEKKDNKNENILKMGDVCFCIDLQHNVLSCAQFILENENTTISTKYLGVYLREIAFFYELFFKYNLTLISKSLIWKKTASYDEIKHNNAEMQTISYDDVIDNAKSLGWINENEFNAISELKKIRNQLVHFSCGEIVDNNANEFNLVKINLDFHIELIKSLLKANKSKFKEPLYAIIENNYL